MNFFFLRRALCEDGYWVLSALSYLLEKNIAWGDVNVSRDIPMNHRIHRYSYEELSQTCRCSSEVCCLKLSRIKMGHRL